MPAAETINLTLTPELLRAVRESVEQGDYASTTEAMRDAVRVWQRQRLRDAERMSAIKARVRRSLGDPRPDLSSEDVDLRLRELFARAGDGAGRA